MSPEEATAAPFPAELKMLIKEKGCYPKQVFNCDEAGLFQKKMCNRTFIHESAKEAPGRKTRKNRLTLVIPGSSPHHKKGEYSVIRYFEKDTRFT